MLRTWNVGRLAGALPGVRAMALRDGLRRGLRRTSIDSAGRVLAESAIAALKYCEQIAGVRFRPASRVRAGLSPAPGGNVLGAAANEELGPAAFQFIHPAA